MTTVRQTRGPERLRNGLQDSQLPKSTIQSTYIDGNFAVEGPITVNSQRVLTVLWEGAFHKTADMQKTLAERQGCRFATREENLKYVDGLLEKERLNTIKEAEKFALQKYRESWIRDSSGGLEVQDNKVVVNDFLQCLDKDSNFGVLFVRL